MIALALRLLALAVTLFEAFAPNFVQSWARSLGERFGKKEERWDRTVADPKDEEE